MEKDFIKIIGKKGVNTVVPPRLEFSHADPNLHGKVVSIAYVNDEGLNICAPALRTIVLLHGGEDGDEQSYYEAYIPK